MEVKKALAPDWRQGLLGAGISGGTLLVLSAIAAWLLSAELMGEKWMNYLAAGILVLSAFAGGWAARGACPVVNVLISGGVFWAALLVMGILVFDGSLAGASATALPILGGNGSALLIPASGRRKRSPARRRSRR